MKGRSGSKISPSELSGLLKGVSPRPHSSSSSGLYASGDSEFGVVKSSSSFGGDASYGQSEGGRFGRNRSSSPYAGRSSGRYDDEESFGGAPSSKPRVTRVGSVGEDGFAPRSEGVRSPRSSEDRFSSEGRFSSGGAPRRGSGGRWDDDEQGAGHGGSPRSSFRSSSSSFDRFDGGNRFGGRSAGGGAGGDRFGKYDSPGSRMRSRDFSEENLPPVNKNFFKECAEVKEMPEERIAAWRKEQNMEILGEGCPRPVFEFGHTSFPPFIQKHLAKLFPSGPSPIQSQGWPLSSSGRDVIASAQTGSGKTIAFVLPALEHIFGQPKLEPGVPGADEPVALILAPTRELAMQIHEEAKRFSGFYGYRTACVYGGAQNRMEQTRQLVAKPQLVIATPGRLIDFVESKLINLARVSYVVLDEADRMLDMGFEPQVRAVLGQIRPDRQTLMWSATWPKRVQELANTFLKNPVRIRIGSDELSANPNVTQEFVFCPWNQRLDRLVDILQQRKGQKILIFTSKKMNADLLADELYDHGHRVQSLHGDKPQAARSRILHDFKSGRAHVLIATDVAARGIDVSDIQVVINYNMPGNAEDYVHRIGRTGRAGKTGISVSFFAEDDESLIPDLIPILSESNQQVPTEFAEYAQRRRAERAERLRRNVPPRRGGSFSSSSSRFSGSSSRSPRPPRR